MSTEAPGRRPSADRAAKGARLDLRVSSEQKRLLEEAAAATDRTVTDFVLASAALAARDVMADRTRFALPPDRWAAFTAAMDREPRYLPRLAAFLSEPSVLDAE